MNIPERHSQVLRMLASRDLDNNASRSIYQSLYQSLQTGQAPASVHLLTDGPNTKTALHTDSGTFISISQGSNGQPLMRVGRLASVETVIQDNPQTKIF